MFQQQAAQPPQTPPRDTSQTAKTGTATLRGHVVAADTGQPLRKAQVRDHRAQTCARTGMTTTDGDGKYEFKELPAGRYNVSASKGSYVSLQYGQQRPFEPGKPLEILDRQRVEKIDFALPHGGDHHRARPRRVRRAAGRRQVTCSAIRTSAASADWCRRAATA